MGKALKRLYGSYDIPKEINQLIELEEDLQKVDLSLAMIGLIPIVEFHPYSITPPDLIPFAETGGDGIHLGFLTDFGLVSDLMDAPIVCVSPTNDPPIRYIARNFKEFMNLALAVPYVEMLEGFWAIQDEKNISEAMKEFVNETPVDWVTMRAHIYNRLKQSFSTEQVNIFHYFHQIKLERAEQIAMQTLDGLGIMGQSNGSSYSFAANRNCDELELERMAHYLNAANLVEKLAFVRDAHYWCILAPDYDEAVSNIIIKLLESLDLTDEVNRVVGEM
ncbi:hypothetical protein [Psychrobacillus sp.]|uniref:hypothetical protein n=1 Tax=Psychrobacillus sp. TaxID=1871623 RepID=UPI0028BD9A58|nr:hypothetical protein [Psychrobacillus sp.]